MKTSSSLTDLEGAVLAVIARDGATTTYGLTRTFLASPSEFWSGSSGAIYPLMRRLQARKLVAGEATSNGKRSATTFAITPRGRAAMEEWLLDAERAADMGFDPLRTRLIFLNLAAPAKRARFLEAVALKTSALRASDAIAEAPPVVRQVNMSWLRLRLSWIKTLRARL